MKRILCIAAFAAALAPSLASSEVEFMSRKYFQNVDGQRYWEVKVTCKGDTTEKLMKRIIGGDEKWCSVDDSSMCNESTFTLSELMCGATESEIAAKAATLDTAPAAEPEAVPENQAQAEAESAEQNNADLRNALVLEQVEIEEKRIQIEQKRLELAQRELELKKQLSN